MQGAFEQLKQPRFSKILVIRLSSLGDVILTSPAVALLKRSFPAAGISYLVKEQFAPIAGLFPGVDEVVTLESLGRGALELRSRLRKMGFDLVVDLHSNLRSRVAAFGLGACVVRYHKRALARRALVLAKNDGWFGVKPVSELYLEAVSRIAPAGEKMAASRPSLSITPGMKAAAAGKFAISGKDRHIALVPGARWATKRWPAAYFSKLGKEAAEKLGARVLVIGDSSDVGATAEVASGIGPSATDLGGRTTLVETASILSMCGLVFTNDTGPMHIAFALSIPLVAFFGPTSENFGFAPFGPGAAVLSRRIGCRPCSLHGSGACPEGHFRCLKDISPAEAIAAGLSLVRNRPDEGK